MARSMINLYNRKHTQLKWIHTFSCPMRLTGRVSTTNNSAISLFFAILFLSVGLWIPEQTAAQNSTGELQSETNDIYEITVTAGDFDRTGTPVSFPLPEEVSPGVYHMKGTDGQTTVLQVDDRGIGSFQLENLKAGTSATYRFDSGEPVPVEETDAGAWNVSLVTNPQNLTIHSNNQQVLSYFHGENDPPDHYPGYYRRGGYIHPVHTPSGTVVTNHLDPNHSHHFGIWSAWTNTRFEGRTPDFWNVHGESGRVDIDTLVATWAGDIHAGFRSRKRFIDLSAPEPVTALNEEWEVRVYRTPADPEVHLFDLTVTQTVNTARPIVLPEHHYGGVGLRGHRDWNDPENCHWLTSDGLGRDGHATRARWAHMGGLSDGSPAGIAVLGHPANFRAPQTMRIHPDMPFFNFAPTQLGEMAIEPGSPLVSRYRFVTYDGEPDPEMLDRLWNDYAYPPGVTVRVR